MPSRSTLFPYTTLFRSNSGDVRLCRRRERADAHHHVDREKNHGPPALFRSQEHTSELQSQFHLVCRRDLHSFPTRRSSDLILVTFAFAVGASVPMLIITLTGRKIMGRLRFLDRKSTRLNSSHSSISYAVEIYTLSLHDALPI